MANEIYTSVTLTARKNGAEVAISTNETVTMTGNEMLNLTQVIGITEELLTLGDITGAPGEMVLKNLDATNFVTIGATGLTGFTIKILPGRYAKFQPGTASIYAIADTAAVRLQKVATEI